MTTNSRDAFVTRIQFTISGKCASRFLSNELLDAVCTISPFPLSPSPPSFGTTNRKKQLDSVIPRLAAVAMPLLCISKAAVLMCSVANQSPPPRGARQAPINSPSAGDGDSSAE